MKLTSRYGDTWEFEETEGGYLWKNLPAFTRFGLFPEDDDICFVDPPGGPFLEVGGEIMPGEVITKIEDRGEFVVLIKTYKKEG